MSPRRVVLAIIVVLSISASAQDRDIQPRFWGDIDYTGNPWVVNMSRPHSISKGLEGRHLSLWASHGYYYDQTKGIWKSQRPALYCTTEDLYTQTIVVPYLIPMLEKAGAIVFTPRERDWQKHEVIIDNDYSNHTNYQEVNVTEHWHKSPSLGFSTHHGYYEDGENPFETGTARQAKTTSKRKNASEISYQPMIPEDGNYAVYVSFPTVPLNIPDAQYVVWHKGQRTEFRVNQQMGGGTWVYLGTFAFSKGCSEDNRVVLTNYSRHKGMVTADAVRFGGGMGNIKRGGTISGLPRALEGARYSAQWAGVPYNLYSTKDGADDYGDDINVRSLETNWLAGGSVYMSSLEGKHVPIELSLAIHSDAGVSKNGKDIIGSLAVCTTSFNDGKLNSGISRMASKDFATSLWNNVTNDLQKTYGKWNKRYLWDRNYSETRLPEVPSAIFETLSHQNFPDMILGQDPNFRFTLARSIYKTILRFVNIGHGTSYVIQPLQPKNFRVSMKPNGKALLSWTPVNDPLEPTAKAKSYNVYVAVGDNGFDNGKNVKGNSFSLKLEPGIPYHFRVTACNQGGESFPTEVLSAVYESEAHKTALIVNGFRRLSAPAVINNDSLRGFDMDADPGVSYGITAGWVGKQECFIPTNRLSEGPGAPGYSNSELAGQFIAGNDFTDVMAHADAIASSHRYNIVSCSSEALLNGDVTIGNYEFVDLMLGLERYMPYSVVPYKTFPRRMRELLTEYTQQGGALIVSGAHIGTDMPSDDEKVFLENTLKVQYQPNDSAVIDSHVSGLGMTFDIYRTLNSRHYAVTAPEMLSPAPNAICAMQYSDGSSAAVGYNGPDYRSFTMAFPFECICSRDQRRQLMRGILNYVNPK